MIDGEYGFGRCILLFVGIVAVATGLISLIEAQIGPWIAIICGSMVLVLGYGWNCRRKKRK